MRARLLHAVVLALGLSFPWSTAAAGPPEPAPRTLTVLTRSALAVSTAGHYRSRIALAVSPTVTASVLRLTAPDGIATSVSASVTAFVRRSDQTGVGDSFAEERIAALRKTDGSWLSQQGTIVASSSNTPTVTLALPPANGSQATLTLTTPSGFDLVTLFIEIRTSGAVVFEELF